MLNYADRVNVSVAIIPSTFAKSVRHRNAFRFRSLPSQLARYIWIPISFISFAFVVVANVLTLEARACLNSSSFNANTSLVLPSLVQYGSGGTVQLVY